MWAIQFVCSCSVMMGVADGQLCGGRGRDAGQAWDQIIYPGMKSAIISICLASQTELDPRKGCFELFGADFLLTEDYQ